MTREEAVVVMKMTLDEAIKHAEEVAEDKEKTIKIYKAAKATEEAIAKCEKCAEEHRQLAEWLRELKQIKGEEE